MARTLTIAALLAAVLGFVFACGHSPTGPLAPATVSLPSCGPEPPDAHPMPMAACPPRAEIDQINRDVSMTFASGLTAGSRVCRAEDGSADLTYVQAVMYMGMAFMRQKTFSKPLPWTDKSAYDWFRQTVAGIVVESGTGNSYCCSPKGVFHVVYNPSGTYNPNWLTLDAVVPVGLIHEARHIETGGHSCNPHDMTIAEMGAGGVVYSYFKWLADYSDEPPDRRVHWAHEAWSYRKNAFCSECYGTTILASLAAGSAEDEGGWPSLSHTRLAPAARAASLR
jgi:hypothetical protein